MAVATVGRGRGVAEDVLGADAGPSLALNNVESINIAFSKQMNY